APTGGAVSGVVPLPAYGDNILIQAQLQRSGDFGFQIHAELLPGSATSFAGHAPPVPWLGEIIGSPATGELTWIADGDGAYDYAALFANWRRFPPDGAQESYSWTLIAPSTGTSFHLPVLPAAYSRYMPDTNDFFDQLSGGVVDMGRDATLAD